MSTALRTILTASLKAQPDAIELYGAVRDNATALAMLAERIIQAESRGYRPGRGTIARLNVITRRLGQSAQAYGRARGM